jgi:hypothetical protein
LEEKGAGVDASAFFFSIGVPVMAIPCRTLSLASEHPVADVLVPIQQ